MSHIPGGIPGGTREFIYDVAVGLVPGYGVTHKFGYNSSIGTTSETVWTEGGLYSWPSSASTMTVSSSDAGDANGGTGARNVVIEGLDGSFNEQSETIVMNGTSGVTTSNSYLRMHRAYVTTVGSTATNDGDIYVGTGTITAGKPANVYTHIANGSGQTLQSFYTIPAGYQGVVTDVTLSANSGKTTNAAFVARTSAINGWRVQYQMVITEEQFLYQPRTPLGVYAAGSDLQLQAWLSASPAAAVSGSFSVLLYPA